MAKILVIDDEPAIRDVLTALLQDEGYDVVTTSDGRLALDLLPVEQPDLIILDIMMPILDGHEVYRRIRERPEWGRMPVIMMSAAVNPETAADGVALFLRKPFDIDQLVETIHGLLG